MNWKKDWSILGSCPSQRNSFTNARRIFCARYRSDISKRRILFRRSAELFGLSETTVVRVNVDQPPTDNRCYGCPLHVSTVKWCISTFGPRPVDVKHPLKL